MLVRFNFSTECKHCGVKGSSFWLWEHQVRVNDKYVCGNCQFKEVVLTKQLERVEIDPFEPK